MAWIAMGSTHVTGAVAGMNIQEGRAVVIAASGSHYDLPTAVLAGAGAKNVFVAILPPDQFPRPTPQSMYQNNSVWVAPMPVTSGSYGTAPYAPLATEFVVDSGQFLSPDPMWQIGPNAISHSTIVALSGWKVQIHKGGAYTLTAGAFTDAAGIRVIGATVEVGANGVFQLSTAAANVVGYVREYRVWGGGPKLTIVLDQKSS